MSRTHPKPAAVASLATRPRSTLHRTEPRPSARLASLSEAAEHVGCSTRTLRRRVADGSLTGYRFGPRLLRIDLDELDAMLRPIPSAGTTGARR